MNIQKTMLALGLASALSMAAPMVIAAENMPDQTMQMSQILQNLHNSGYNVVLKVEFDNGAYKASVIDPQGKQIKVQVAPTSGEITKPKSETTQLSIIDAAKKVEEAGYHNIFKITSHHDKYEIKALNKENKKVSLDVDAKTGKISKELF